MQKLDNTTKCTSGDAIVGYIYNELPSAERLAFEDHLLDCTACTDEFAAVADSRYAVYEWQKVEFEPMATPRFVIPYAETKVSWLDSIKGIFATGPRLATAGAFGLLVAVVGSAAIYMSSGPTDIASIDEIRVTETFTDQPTTTVSKALELPVPDVSEKNDGVKPELIAVSKPAPKVEQKRKPSNVRRNTRQNIGSEAQAKVPRLNDFEDISDDSLRLADLVADVDTRD